MANEDSQQAEIASLRQRVTDLEDTAALVQRVADLEAVIAQFLSDPRMSRTASRAIAGLNPDARVNRVIQRAENQRATGIMGVAFGIPTERPSPDGVAQEP